MFHRHELLLLHIIGTKLLFTTPLSAFISPPPSSQGADDHFIESHPATSAVPSPHVQLSAAAMVTSAACGVRSLMAHTLCFNAHATISNHYVTYSWLDTNIQLAASFPQLEESYLQQCRSPVFAHFSLTQSKRPPIFLGEPPNICTKKPRASS